MTFLAILAVHEPTYLAMKTTGDLHRRATQTATTVMWIAAPLTTLSMLK